LESLEADNSHDDPHADLVMSKKALNLFQEVQHGVDHSSASTSNVSGSQGGGAANSSITSSKASKRRLKTAEYYKQRYARYMYRRRLPHSSTSAGLLLTLVLNLFHVIFQV
jgi:hypothetical protein